MSATRRQPATGYTRCPGCERRFSDEPARATTTIPGNIPAPSRTRGYAAGRAGQTIAVDLRWHVDCLGEHEARNAAYRAEVVADRRAAVESIARDAGLDVAAALAEFDKRQGRSA